MFKYAWGLVSVYKFYASRKPEAVSGYMHSSSFFKTVNKSDRISLTIQGYDKTNYNRLNLSPVTKFRWLVVRNRLKNKKSVNKWANLTNQFKTFSLIVK